ncbi:UV excision repair protein Rad23 [Aphanomyces invadans]|uniref:UV excision repair protein RAD23 n=1 Tax=Aphanomyces invadans TaxID=157072 RepID=A0A024TCU4_9STRA|nr:UV excision repair protein Rad23 [Aphanomyces invadans]ETV91834.1 UV excision repair protein Rad23 [Aphanomyces invadans]|eukprot:XP_008879471.1 UV excision repair protein Rad23 [Aphanomyces invadans]
MKLTVKTLQGVSYPIEAELEDTVLSVKGKVEAVNGAAVDNQKLIHAGKVLKDDSKLSEYNVKENDFLVVMVTKPKVVRKTAADPAPPSTPAAAPVAAPAAVAQPPVQTPAPSTASSTTATTSTPAAGAPGIVVGEALSETVRQLVDMGFPEDQVRAALQAAFHNPERAVEYLMNGIPEQPAAPPASTTAPASGGLGAPTSLEALRHHPQFDALRRMIQANPSALPTVLQQIGAQNPQLLQLIHQNQEQFVAMLNEPIAEAATPSATPSVPASPFGDSGADGMPTPQQLQQLMASLSPQQQAAMAAQMGMTYEQLQQFTQMLNTMPPEAMAQLMQQMAGGEGGHGAPTRIHLTEEEAAAVGRLVDMGFDRNEVIQAYLACDKNEALAANFLMDSMSGDYADASGGDSNDDIYG